MLNLVVVPHEGGPKAANDGAARTSIHKERFCGTSPTTAITRAAAAQATIAAATMARPTTAVRIAEAVRPPPLDHVMRLSVCLGCG
jgi:hypothetical protein